MKLDTFYNLLVKESLESEFDGNDPDGCGVGDAGMNEITDLENTKTALEVSHSFSDGSSYFLSYFFRTLGGLATSADLHKSAVCYAEKLMSS